MPDLAQRLARALSDRYRVERILGRGGAATVYLAEDLRHRRRVAIKVLDPEVASAVGPARFRREIETAARLTHPHILPLFDSGEADGLLFYVMPFVSGESLRRRLSRERQLPVEEVSRIAREVAGALDYAHRQGVVHRDIKPENILLEEGHALVADFGIARLVSPGAADSRQLTLTDGRMTTAGTSVGTPAYMSPEQAGGGEIDARSDQYSLGCVVYEMLAGRPPFTGPSAPSLLQQHLSIDPRPVAELRPAVPAAAGNALARALAKTPADRFPTVTRFAEALGIPGREGTGRPSLAVPGRRAPWLVPALVSSLGVAALLALVWAWNPGGVRERLLPRPPAPRVKSLAVMPLENLSRDPEEEYFADGLTEALIAELYRIPALSKVVSPKSVMLYKGTRKPTSQIASELKVDALIEGAAIREGGRVRVTVHLVDGRTDSQLWADSFDRDYRDILALHSDVARAIAEGIRVKLGPSDLPPGGPIDPEAYQLYLKGRHYWNRATFEDLEKARDFFQRSIDRDPTFAKAYCGLADTYGVLGVNYLPPRATWPRARADVLRALELDSTIAEPHTTLAAVQIFFDWDWKGAGYHLARATALAPNYALARNLRSYYLELTGHPAEAMAEIQRARELDPLVLLIQLDVGIRHYFARHYDQAIAEYRGITASHSELAPVTYWSWLAYEQQGSYAEALGQLRRFAAGPGAPASGTPARDSLPRKRYLAAVRSELPRLETLYAQHRFWALDIAAIHTLLGERDAALEWLEKAYQDREGRLPWVTLDPRFDSLRADARFQDLVRRLGLAL